MGGLQIRVDSRWLWLAVVLLFVVTCGNGLADVQRATAERVDTGVGLSEERSRLKRARELDDLGEVSDAIAELQNILASSKDPITVTQANLLLGRLARAAGDFRGAIDHFTVAAQDPLFEADASIEVARTRHGSGDFDGAAAQLRKILEALPTQHPRYGRGVIALAFVCAYDETLDSSLALLDAARHVSRDNAVRLALGQLLFADSRYESAVEVFEASLQSRRVDTYTLLWLNLLETAMGRPNPTERLKERGRDVDVRIWPNPIVDYLLGNSDEKTLYAAAEHELPWVRTRQRIDVDFFAVHTPAAIKRISGAAAWDTSVGTAAAHMASKMGSPKPKGLTESCASPELKNSRGRGD